MPTQTDYASSPSATDAKKTTPTSNAPSAVVASTPAPGKFVDECILLAKLPNGTVHPVLHPPQQRTQQAPGIRIFHNAEAAAAEMSTGRLASLPCAIIPLKDLFD